MNAEGNILSEFGLAALEHAGRGWHVFPAPPGSKKSHKSAKHSEGRAWGATITPAEIRRDWTRWPGANVGITTGPASGIFVIDLDRKNGVDGVQWLENRIAEHGDWPHTIEVLTPSGGCHAYFKYPGDFDPKTCEGEIAPGVDVRGWGGMVLGVPSVKPGTGSYRWKNPPGLFDVADAPQWLLDLLPRKGEDKPANPPLRIDTGGNGYGEKALREEIAGVWAAPVGTRNGALNRAAFSLGQLVAGGELDGAIVADRLTSAAQAAGLDPAETAATIRSGMDAGMAEPRRRPDSAPPPPRERTSRFYPAASLKGKPVKPREWLVQGLVPTKTVTLFSGDGGTGKSLLALQLAIAVAAQTAWLGKTVNTGRVIYLSAEDDDDELHRRIDDILRAEGCSYDDLPGLTLRSLAGEDALLAVETGVALTQSELFKELDARAVDESPSLIVVDTLADVYPANENDRAKVRQFIGILRGLALKRNCAVLLLGHPSLTGLNSGTGTSGSTAWNNSVRSRIYLSRITDDDFEADPDRRVMTTMKANYGRIGGETYMKWQGGVFIAEQQPSGLDALAAGAKAQRVFMKLLSTFTEQGRRVNHAGGTRYAPKLFAEHPGNEGMTKRALKAAMEGLLAAGKIKIETEGPASRRTSFIVEAGQ